MTGDTVEFGSAAMLEEPYSFYASKRSECPVFAVPARNMYVVTRHQDIEYVLRHPELFSSRGRTPIVSYPGQRYQTTPDLVGTDAPEHKAIREIHLTLLSPKRLREMRPAMEADANRLIDQFVGQREVEFIKAFAKPFPAGVMGQLLCVPPEMHQRLDDWAVQYFELFDRNLHHPGEGSPDPKLTNSFVEFMNYCGDLAVDRREHPRGDALSDFVNARRPDGSAFSIDEMANYIRLLVTGAQTTTSLVVQSLVETLKMPGPRNFEDRTQVQRILDETLRLDGPATYCPRICAQDVELGGVALPKGTRIFLAWQSGSRDEKVFECPAEFRPDRGNLARHLGFGLGHHRCIGAPLALVEGDVALRAMFQRFCGIRLSAKNDYRHDTSLTAMRVLKELHLELEAAVQHKS